MAKIMEVSYKKLWKILIDRDMSKTDLRLQAGISTMALAKLGKNENVSMDVLKKICVALDCNIGDIVDLIPAHKKMSKKIKQCKSKDVKCPLAGCILTENEEN